MARDLAQIERAHHEATFARVGQQLPAQVGRANRHGLDLIDVFAESARNRQLEAHQADVAEDAGQQVVEVVRDAAGQDAQALQLLRVQQLALEQAAVALGGDAYR